MKTETAKRIISIPAGKRHSNVCLAMDGLMNDASAPSTESLPSFNATL